MRGETTCNPRTGALVSTVCTMNSAKANSACRAIGTRTACASLRTRRYRHATPRTCTTTIMRQRRKKPPRSEPPTAALPSLAWCKKIANMGNASRMISNLTPSASEKMRNLSVWALNQSQSRMTLSLLGTEWSRQPRGAMVSTARATASVSDGVRCTRLLAHKNTSSVKKISQEISGCCLWWFSVGYCSL
jgi:hypothetical protein